MCYIIYIYSLAIYYELPYAIHRFWPESFGRLFTDFDLNHLFPGRCTVLKNFVVAKVLRKAPITELGSMPVTGKRLGGGVLKFCGIF